MWVTFSEGRDEVAEVADEGQVVEDAGAGIDQDCGTKFDRHFDQRFFERFELLDALLKLE